MNKQAKKYNNIKVTIGIAKGILTFLLLFAFLYFGFSLRLEKYISETIQNPYFVLILFASAILIGLELLLSPIDFYSDFVLEKKFNLSNQKFSGWLWDTVKSLLVGLLLAVPLLIVFYYLLLHTGNLWWLYFGIVLFFFSVILAQILPVLILPIFYKVTPIEDEELRKRIEKVIQEGGLKIRNIYKFNMSKETKKGNAAFTGLGKTKRIILGDTLLENFSPEEIETIVAHEVGHYKKKHILKNILLSTAFSFITLYLISVFYKLTLPMFGFTKITQIAALPLLFLWAMIVGIILMPLSNKISRMFEYQADEYAVKSTGKKEIFIEALLKLNKQNLGDEEPHPFVEWLFYSHPSIKKRIEFLKSLKV